LEIKGLLHELPSKGWSRSELHSKLIQDGGLTPSKLI